MTTELSDHDIGERMLDVFDERGWHQGGYYDRSQPIETAPVCLAGALRCVFWGRPTLHSDFLQRDTSSQKFFEIMTKFSKQLEADGMRGPMSIPPLFNPSGYNDLPTTSEEDIRLLIKRTLLK